MADIYSLFENPWKEDNPLAVLGFDRPMVFELKRRPDVFDQAVQRMFRLRMIIFHPDHSQNQHMATRINSAMEFLGSAFYRKEIIEEFLRHSAGDQRTALVSAKREADQSQEKLLLQRGKTEELRTRLQRVEAELSAARRQLAERRIAEEGFWIASSITYSNPSLSQSAQVNSHATGFIRGRRQKRVVNQYPLFVVVEAGTQWLLYVISNKEGQLWRLTTRSKPKKGSVVSLLDEWMKPFVTRTFYRYLEMQEHSRMLVADRSDAAKKRATMLLSTEDVIRSDLTRAVEEFRAKRGAAFLTSLREKYGIFTTFASVGAGKTAPHEYVAYLVFRAAKDRHPLSKKLLAELEQLLLSGLNARFADFRKILTTQPTLKYQPHELRKLTMSPKSFRHAFLRELRERQQEYKSERRYLGAVHPDLCPKGTDRSALACIDPYEIVHVVPGIHATLRLNDCMLTTTKTSKVEEGAWRVSVHVEGTVLGIWVANTVLTRLSARHQHLHITETEDEDVEEAERPEA